MAANQVGGAVVELRAENEGLKKKLKDTEGALKRAGASWTGWATSIGGGAFSIISDSFAGLVGALGIKGLELTIVGVASQISAAFDEIDNAIDSSVRTGVDLNELWGLQWAGKLAGVNGDVITGSLDKLNRATGEALSGNRKFAATFAELGISQEQLASGSPIDTYHAVADAISQTGSAADRTRLAMDVFGKSGAALVPLLVQGGDAIRAQQAEYESIAGVIGSRAQQDIAEAQDASDRASLSFTAIWRFAATQLANVKEVVAIVLKDLAIGFRTALPTEIPFGEIAINTFEWIAKSGLYLFNVLKEFGSGFLTNFVAPIIEGCGDVLNTFADMVENILAALNNSAVRTGLAVITGGLLGTGGDLGGDLVAGMRNAANGLTTAANGVRAAGQAVGDFELPINDADIGAYFDKIRQTWAERGGEFGELLNELNDEDAAWLIGYLDQLEQTAAQEDRINSERQQSFRDLSDTIAGQIENFGLSDFEIKLKGMEESGVDPGDLALLRFQQDFLDAQKAGADITKRFANPTDVLNDEIAHLNELFDMGQLSTEVYNRALDEAITTAERAGEIGQVDLPQASMAGSSGAMNTWLRHQFSDVALDPQERILRVQNAQLVQQQEQNRTLGLIANRLPMLQGV